MRNDIKRLQKTENDIKRLQKTDVTVFVIPTCLVYYKDRKCAPQKKSYRVSYIMICI